MAEPGKQRFCKEVLGLKQEDLSNDQEYLSMDQEYLSLDQEGYVLHQKVSVSNYVCCLNELILLTK